MSFQLNKLAVTALVAIALFVALWVAIRIIQNRLKRKGWGGNFLQGVGGSLVASGIVALAGGIGGGAATYVSSSPTTSASTPTPTPSPTPTNTPVPLPSLASLESIQLTADDVTSDLSPWTPILEGGRQPLGAGPPVVLNPLSKVYCPQTDDSNRGSDDVLALWGTISAQVYIGDEVVPSTDAAGFVVGVNKEQKVCGYSATARSNLGNQAVEMSIGVPIYGATLDRIIFRHGNLLLEVAVFTQHNNAAALANKYAQVLETKFDAAISAHPDLASFIRAA